MSRGRKQRAYGVPQTVGPLKISRPGQPVEYVPRHVADKAARTVVRQTQGRGKPGRDM